MRSMAPAKAGIAKHGGDVFKLNARLREVGYVSDGGFEIADGDVAHRLMLLVNFLNVMIMRLSRPRAIF